ncbi:TonB-dependent receptor plug domain-containing protein [Paremcibacter congregatus]|uniref:TonB-dependent receptor n=1 Tax=Paremcibacter congregatus TaxID=2043170 RepID=A0A2G4YQV8_9PROT|nr:TonB-dependent receptor [Paremcibacter congregatus]PHZ84711.1 TonB-dependent receptor [Paremcibacter congregatus]QDE28906.1 TonB-dependent receptor [Paremcibacter congregatus]
MEISFYHQKKFITGVSILALMAAIPSSPQAFAQDATDDASTFEEVVVTGSRIKRGNLSTPTPVTTLDSEALKVSGTNNVADLMRELPSVGLSGLSSANSSRLIQNSGLNTINLRNLGSARTLVLVNGRRYIAGQPGSSAVDLNTVPTDLIERVEVITGGASAVYGSDAVAGVVNFILKDDFSGVAIDAQYGLSEKGDGDKLKTTLTMGGNFNDDKGNATLHFAYNKEYGVKSSARGIKDHWYDITDNTIYDPNHSSYVPQGLFFAGGDPWTYDPSGTLVNEYDGDRDGFDRSPYRTISIPTERILVSGNSHYDIREDVTLYSELMFAQVNTDAKLEPFYFDTGFLKFGGIPISNPLIPQAIRDDAVANGVTELGFRRRFLENDGRQAVNSRRTMRILLGLKGEINDQWSWDANYSYGRTTQKQTFSGEMNIDLAVQSLNTEADPTNPGGVRCADERARGLGCVPMNIWGKGSISPEALAYVSADTNLQATITQQVITAGVTNSALFTLPGGDVGFAAGIEHRRESSETINDPLVVAGLTGGNKVANTVGKFNVTEFYAETNVPLVEGVSFAQYLGLEAAFRYADYSTIGGVSSWKVGGEWAPIDDLRFRAVYAKSTRAPNINDLFAGAGQTFPDINDPCNGVTPTSNNPAQKACLLDPVLAAAVDAGPFVVGSFERFDVSGYNVGNPNLNEETAKTITVGAVITPSAIEGLTASVDYFRIKVDNAIQFTGRQLILDKCYESASLDNIYCDQITRRARNSAGGLSGHLEFINDGPANQGYQLVSGIDFKVNYTMDLDEGDLNFGLYYVRTLSSELQTSDGSVVDQLGDLGGSANYKNKGNLNITYVNGPLTVAWKVNYLGQIYDSLSVHNARAEASEPDYDLNNIGAKIYNNMQIRYAFGDDQAYEVYGGINNVFNTKAPYLPTGTSSSNAGSDTSSAYDAIGRYFYLGAKATF